MIGSTNVRKLKKGELLFGDGSDGDLVVPANTTMEWDVKEDIGRIYKQYNSLTLEEGSTLKPKHRCNGAIILVKGDCIIRGQIDMNRCAPLLNDYENETLNDRHVKLMGVLKGGNGGKGGAGYWTVFTNKFSAPTDADRISAFGGAGGAGHRLGGGFGGGGAGGNRYKSDIASYIPFPEYEIPGGDSEPRPSFGITWPCKTNGAYGAGGAAYYYYEHSNDADSDWYLGMNGEVNGGAAPGGSGGTNDAQQTSASFLTSSGSYYGYSGLAGMAYGGGAIWLYVGGNLVIEKTGSITSNGGAGARLRTTTDKLYNATSKSIYTTNTKFGGCGGSGGGGIIAIVYGGNYTNDGEVVADGAHGVTMDSQFGFGSNVTTYQEACPLGAGTAGSIGTVKVIHFSRLKEV